MSRSLKKGPFVEDHLLQKIVTLNADKTKKIVFTWSRSSTILPTMIGHTIAIHNGREHFPVLISDQMIGEKLGEFSETRTFVNHAGNRRDKKSKR